MKLVLGVALCIALCAVPINSVNNKLTEVFSWKFIDYAWEKPEDRDAAIASGEFVPANNLPLGLEVWKDKLFITVPRWKDGVVATLNYVKITDDEEATTPPTDTPEPTDDTETPEPPTTLTPPEDVTTPTDPTTEEVTTPTDPTTEEVTTPTDPTTEEVTTPTDPTTPTTEDDTTPTDPTTPTTTDLTTPTTPEPPTTAEDPTTATPTDEDDETLPTASILDMPARTLDGVRSNQRLQRAAGEEEDDEEFDVNIFSRKTKKDSKRKDKKKEEDETEEKKKKKKKSKKKDEEEDEEKKSKDKKKKKKKCKPKPKPTTAAPPPPTTPAPETTGTTDATAGTETTAPPPPPPRSPALIPYPSFAANRVPLDGKKADGPAPIVSVFRVWADTCDRLWVMDTGVADILGKTAVVSKPRILIYNLNNDEHIKTYEFKDSDSEEHSFFANIIVDTDPQNCDKAFAYVPDLGGYGIVSYDFANDKSRRIKHNYFHFDPLAGNMEVGGVNFQWTDGVFSLALGKPMDDGFRTVYFHCLASTKEFSVSSKVLKNDDASSDSYYDYKLVGDRGEKSQSSASYIHEDTGVMFYTQLQKDSVNCWNTNKPLTAENLVEVASDNETMIFTNDLKVDREGNLWVLTDKLPVFIYRGLDDSDVNYRIFTAPVNEAIAGTNCAP